MELPNDVIRLIIKAARLDIDTRLALRVKPGRLTEDATYDVVRERLRETHIRRARLWKKSAGALESISSPDIILGPQLRIFIRIQVWWDTHNVQMTMQAAKIHDSEEVADVAVLRSTCCFFR